MFNWEKDGIRFMKDASEHTSYYQRLAERIRPYVTKESRICDTGCGLGYLSLELAPFAKEVVSIDADARALSVLEEKCQEQSIQNIQTLCGDAKKLDEAEHFDCMIFCFFGNMDEILEIAKKHCRETVIVIKKNYTKHRFSVGSYAFLHDGYKEAGLYLAELGIPFEGTELELEFGQPFRSVEDARLFYEIYSQDSEKEAITDEFLRKQLIQTEEGAFRYYMPHRRRLGFMKLDAEDIRKRGMV